MLTNALQTNHSSSCVSIDEWKQTVITVSILIADSQNLIGHYIQNCGFSCAAYFVGTVCSPYQLISDHISPRTISHLLGVISQNHITSSWCNQVIFLAGLRIITVQQRYKPDYFQMQNAVNTYDHTIKPCKLSDNTYCVNTHYDISSVSIFILQLINDCMVVWNDCATNWQANFNEF